MKKLLLIAAAAALVAAGCATDRTSYTQGAELIVGIPTSETGSTLNMDVLQYVSGQRLVAPGTSGVRFTARTLTAGSYFGVIKTDSEYTLEAAVTPPGSTNVPPAFVDSASVTNSVATNSLSSASVKSPSLPRYDPSWARK